MNNYLKNKNFKKAVSFLAIFAGALFLSSAIVNPDGGEVYDIINTNRKLADIAKEEKNSIDVMFTGNSLVFRAISPLQIYSEYGITGYDVSDGAMRLCDQCSILNSSYKSQTPDLIVIEPYVMFSEAQSHANNYAYPTNFLEDIFPIFHYHTFYKSYIPTFMNMDTNELDEDDIDGMKGFQYSEKVEPYIGDIDYMSKRGGQDEIPSENLHYLDKILSFANKNEIKLLIAAIPSPVNYNLSKHEAIQDWADKNEVAFLDMNMHNDEIGIDWSTDTKDAGDHLNLSGSKKVSAYLGKYINDNYNTEDHRDEEAFADWTEAVKNCSVYN